MIDAVSYHRAIECAAAFGYAPNPAWKAAAGSHFQAIFSCMRQHGHFGLA